MATQPTTTYTRAELLPYQAPETAREVSGQFAASLDLAPGTVVALNSSTNKLVAYDNAGSNGTNVALGALRYGVQTDSSGNVINFDERGALEDTAPYYYTGKFRTTRLVVGGTPGLTSAALASLNGRLIEGTLADGVVQF